MENQNIKRGRGRPKVFTNEELKQHKTAYMLTKNGTVMFAKQEETIH